MCCRELPPAENASRGKTSIAGGLAPFLSCQTTEGQGKCMWCPSRTCITSCVLDIWQPRADHPTQHAQHASSPLAAQMPLARSPGLPGRAIKAVPDAGSRSWCPMPLQPCNMLSWSSPGHRQGDLPFSAWPGSPLTGQADTDIEISDFYDLDSKMQNK